MPTTTLISVNTCTDDSMQGPPLALLNNKKANAENAENRNKDRPMTASQKYKFIIEEKKIPFESDHPQRGNYEKNDLLWGSSEPPRKPKRNRPKPPPWKPREITHEGREMAVQGMHYWVRRKSHFNPPTEPRHLGFTTMLVGVGLYYLNLFLYWGVLGMYDSYSAPGWMWDEYQLKKDEADLRGFPLEPAERKDKGIYYLEDMFKQFWLMTMALTFFCPFALAVYNFRHNTHRHGMDIDGKGGRSSGGKWSALRSLLQVDLLYEMLISIPKKDQTYQFRFIKISESLLRGMPMACTQLYVMWRVENVLTAYQSSTLLVSLMFALASVTLTFLTFVESAKPCAWGPRILAAYPLPAKLAIVGFGFSSALLHCIGLAMFAVRWETQVYQYMLWMLLSRAILWAYFDVADSFGRDCITDLFRTKRDVPTLVDLEEQKFERYYSFGIVVQSFLVGLGMALPMIIIDLPLIECKKGRWWHSFWPLCAQWLLSTIDVQVLVNEACKGGLHPVPVSFNCVCDQTMLDRQADIRCTREHLEAENASGGISSTVNGLWGLNLACLLVIWGLLRQPKAEQVAVTFDDVDDDGLEEMEQAVKEERSAQKTMTKKERSAQQQQQAEREAAAEEKANKYDSDGGSEGDEESEYESESDDEDENKGDAK